MDTKPSHCVSARHITSKTTEAHRDPCRHSRSAVAAAAGTMSGANILSLLLTSCSMHSGFADFALHEGATEPMPWRDNEVTPSPTLLRLASLTLM